MKFVLSPSTLIRSASPGTEPVFSSRWTWTYFFFQNRQPAHSTLCLRFSPFPRHIEIKGARPVVFICFCFCLCRIWYIEPQYCLYLIRQFLLRPTAACIWYSNIHIPCLLWNGCLNSEFKFLHHSSIFSWIPHWRSLLCLLINEMNLLPFSSVIPNHYPTMPPHPNYINAFGHSTTHTIVWRPTPFVSVHTLKKCTNYYSFSTI